MICQDTVLALQALGAYAEKTYSPDVTTKLSVKSGDIDRTLEVNKDNAIVQQSVDVITIIFILQSYRKPYRTLKQYFCKIPT